MKETFFFRSAHATVIAEKLKPVKAQLNSDTRAFINNLNNLKSNTEFLVGAIPFNINENASLYTTDQVGNKLPASFKKNDSEQQHLQEFNYVPSEVAYKQQVSKAIELIKQKCITKLVMARSLEIGLTDELVIDELLFNFCSLNQAGYTFSVPIDLTKPYAHLLIGVSPELLIRKQGAMITTNPLAGSIARGKTPQQDEANAQMLLHSAKDQFEHSLVVKSIAEVLEPYCKQLVIPDKPSLIATTNLWHLSTFIQAELHNPTLDVLEVALQLHPTPAVGGYPKQLVTHYINELETFNRDLYAGLVGWSNAQGDGEWAVTIRCAECKANKLRLFAGAGIVEDSIAESELIETAVKFNTLLIALGIRPIDFKLNQVS